MTTDDLSDRPPAANIVHGGEGVRFDFLSGSRTTRTIARIEREPEG